MSERTRGDDGDDRGTSKPMIVLILAFVFGTPLLVTWLLLNTDPFGAPVPGVQAGGSVHGTVRGPDGSALAGIAVDLSIVSATGAREAAGSTHSASDGRFELVAPASDGHYELRAGSASWKHATRALSFLDRSGEPRSEREVAIDLVPSAHLVVSLASERSQPLGDGTYELETRAGPAMLFGLIESRTRIAGALRGGSLDIADLVPGRARLSIRLSSGETVDLDLVLAPGENRKTVEL